MALVRRLVSWLTSIVRSLFGQRPSLLTSSLEPPDSRYSSRMRRRGPEPPYRPLDPFNSVREPRWNAPTGRGAAVCVEEPVDDEYVAAVSGGSRDSVGS